MTPTPTLSPLPLPPANDGDNDNQLARADEVVGRELGLSRRFPNL
jgi:hypothetical protein